MHPPDKFVNHLQFTFPKTLMSGNINCLARKQIILGPSSNLGLNPGSDQSKNGNKLRVHLRQRA